MSGIDDDLGWAVMEAAKHAPDERRGGCICGFCAFSTEHAVVSVVIELNRRRSRPVVSSTPREAGD